MKIIDDMTSFVFVKNEPQAADIIFLPGSTAPEVPTLGAELYNKGFAPYVMPSGKYSKGLSAFPGDFRSESDYYARILMEKGVPENAILYEREAEFTMQNGLFSKRVCDSMGLDIRKAIIACKSFHARRCLMYYSFAFPNTEFIICPIDVGNITRDNWYKERSAFDVVMGEVEKIGGQLKDDFAGFLKSEKLL